MVTLKIKDLATMEYSTVSLFDNCGNRIDIMRTPEKRPPEFAIQVPGSIYWLIEEGEGVLVLEQLTISKTGKITKTGISILEYNDDPEKSYVTAIFESNKLPDTVKERVREFIPIPFSSLLDDIEPE